MNMGFSEAQVEATFAKAKNFTLEELIEIAVQLPPPTEEPKKPKEDSDDIITWKAYDCEVCTLSNLENPGPQC
jgi:hypothetical protein